MFIYVYDFSDSFLAKYCIFNRSNLEMYRHAFNAVSIAVVNVYSLFLLLKGEESYVSVVSLYTDIQL